MPSTRRFIGKEKGTLQTKRPENDIAAASAVQWTADGATTITKPDIAHGTGTMGQLMAEGAG